jgi:leucyl aminopeptidase
MDTILLSRALDEVQIETLIIPCFERSAASSALEPDTTRAADERTGGLISELYNSGEFTGKFLESALLHRPAGIAAKRLLVIGCGKQEEFGSTELRKVGGAALRVMKGKSARCIGFVLGNSLATMENTTALVEGALLGDFEPDIYKTDPKKAEKMVEEFTVVIPPGDGSVTRKALERGRVMAEAQNFTRSLVNEPANRLTPTVMADKARQMASEEGLECEVLDRARRAALGMGALLGVAVGSAEPPALIILRYRPPMGISGVHLGLVGKGVTFDTGGVSIKPADGMEKMKYDMAGGAAVLGAMKAIAQLKPTISVTAYVPAVENMVSSKAQRPGDIVKSMSGKTIEVLNTDAEGRLILADALTYAIREGCTHLVDAATLTGAIVVALGHFNIGAFSNNDAFLEKVRGIAKSQGEKMWPMPIDDEYKDYLKSAFADLPNIGGRYGGAVSAAMFLKEFVEDKPWVHLDIAGTAWLDEGKPFLSKGPSGVAVRTFVSLAMQW